MKNCSDGTCNNADLIEELTAERDALNAENAKLREALWWYANLENYDAAGAPGYNQDCVGNNAIDDYGKVAREALV